MRAISLLFYYKFIVQYLHPCFYNFMGSPNLDRLELDFKENYNFHTPAPVYQMATNCSCEQSVVVWLEFFLSEQMTIFHKKFNNGFATFSMVQKKQQRPPLASMQNTVIAFYFIVSLLSSITFIFQKNLVLFASHENNNHSEKKFIHSAIHEPIFLDKKKIISHKTVCRFACFGRFQLFSNLFI